MKQAFPYRGEYFSSAGMSLRDYFAGQALVGLLGGRTQRTGFTAEEAARHSVTLADALCAALKEADKANEG